ncbi:MULTISPECIES: type VII toxin-antitoxin system HepT family RNase toxin [Rhodanobacter]|uniref:type VII toxin-antitoxin system HepT family RNase toxin n=1 Tax=Rhodanobacter TaxID=75309 RepID=UPI000408FA81|nr:MULTISPECIES: DUF86 domain-containing protein [Rhodanobacter]UJJ55936.1 DUF86 domain-containing protein [Rhodanobacter thiooxydans]
MATLADNPDLQDNIVVLNLSRAVQISVDLALHALSSMQQAAPYTMGEAFDQLAQADFIPAELALRLRKAVGFRNIAVHSYSSMDWQSCTRSPPTISAISRISPAR